MVTFDEVLKEIKIRDTSGLFREWLLTLDGEYIRCIYIDENLIYFKFVQDSTLKQLKQGVINETVQQN